jgi:hypothetical protein
MIKKNYIKYLVLFYFFIFLLFFFQKKPKNQEPNLNVIKNINYVNSKIKSISCDLSEEMTNSYFFYSKPNELILNTYFFNREQSKISSNGEIYWFWIKKFDSKSVYYCNLSKIDETSVIDPLKPDLIKSIICIDEIPLERSTIKITDQIEVSFKYKQYDRVIIVQDEKIKSQYWYINKEPILSVEVLKTEQIPTLLKVTWHREKYTTRIRLKNIKINQEKKLDHNMPNLNKINLEEN